MARRGRGTSDAERGLEGSLEATDRVADPSLGRADYERLLGAVDDAAFVFDVVRDGGALSFAFRWNNATHRDLTGITVEEYRGAGPRELFDSSDAEAVAARYRYCVETAEPVAYEETLAHDTGTVQWQTRLTPVVEDGTVTRLLGVATETTGLEGRVQALHDAARRLAAAESPDAIAAVAVEAADALLDGAVPSVWYPTGDGSALEPVATAEAQRGFLEAADGTEPTQGPESPIWRAFESGETIVQDPLDPADHPGEGPPHSAIVAPLGDHGALCCAAPATASVTDRQVEVAELLARHVRLALDRYDHRTALDDHQQFTDDMLDALEDVVYVLDTDGELIGWNAALEDVTGYSADEIDSMHPTEFFPPADAEAAAEAIYETFDTGRNRVELDIQTADGDTVPFEFVANAFETPDGDTVMAGIGRDRSRRVEYERRLALAVEAADAGVWEWVIETDDVIWEASMESLLGLESDSFGGTLDAFADRVHPADRDEFLRLVDDSLRRLEGFEREFRLRHESGEYVWLLLRTQLVTDQDGRPTRMVGVAIDVSERTDRTRQLDVLDRVLRHNLRNDMTLIQGWAGTIRATDGDGDAEAGRIIAKSQELMATVDKEREIVDVIADQPQQTPIDVGAVCDRVLADARQRFPDARIAFEHPGSVAAVATERLGRAVEELVENAIVHNDRDHPDLALSVERDDDSVRIVIADDGPGVPEKETGVLTREHEVEPLYHGTGLGLWLVNWIVKRAGGRIAFAENEPRGSVITIELDAAS